MEDQNRQFREIFENSPVGIIFFDKEGNLVDVNPSALKVLRVSQLEDVKGINLFVNPYVESRKEELFKNGIIKLQYSSDLDTAKDYGFYTPTESGIIYVDYTVSITDSGFIGQIQDITEHKQVENELQESENTLRSFFDATGDMRGIVDVVADNDVRHIEDNVVTAGFLGLKPEQMRNKLGSELGEPEEILCRWIGHYEESRITGLPVTFEYQDIRENNKSHLAVTVNYLGLKSQGQPRFAYVVRDITEQKKAEEELKKSEEKFSKAFHGNPAAMILQDAGDGRILDVNESFMKLTGCSRDELIGHTTAELNLIDTEKRKQNLTEYQDEGSVKDTEFELQTKSGEKYIVTGYSEAIEHEGESRAITFFYDITKRKKAEKALYESKSQFQTLIHNLNSGVALVDESGRFAVVNPSFLRMFNLDNGMDILNVNSQDWSRWEVSGEDGKLLHVDEHPVRKVAITGKPVNNQLVSVRNPGTNRLTWMLTSAEPILDKDGSINMIICTYYDITVRNKL
ncbi:MAG: PAS domain S-box protein [Methanobacterium sp.]